MGKVTSKLQVTVPKTIADQYGIRPGAEIEWVPAGDGIRVILRSRARRSARATEEVERSRRLRLFDQATARQRAREQRTPPRPGEADRGWKREELYDRGRPR